jgi:hypothetical protein
MTIKADAYPNSVMQAVNTQNLASRSSFTKYVPIQSAYAVLLLTKRVFKGAFTRFSFAVVRNQAKLRFKMLLQVVILLRCPSALITLVG